MPAHEPSEKDKLSILMSFVREHEERKTNDKLGIADMKSQQNGFFLWLRDSQIYFLPLGFSPRSGF